MQSFLISGVVQNFKLVWDFTTGVRLITMLLTRHDLFNVIPNILILLFIFCIDVKLEKGIRIKRRENHPVAVLLK